MKDEQIVTLSRTEKAKQIAYVVKLLFVYIHVCVCVCVGEIDLCVGVCKAVSESFIPLRQKGTNYNIS